MHRLGLSLGRLHIVQDARALSGLRRRLEGLLLGLGGGSTLGFLRLFLVIEHVGDLCPEQEDPLLLGKLPFTLIENVGVPRQEIFQAPRRDIRSGRHGARRMHGDCRGVEGGRGYLLESIMGWMQVDVAWCGWMRRARVWETKVDLVRDARRQVRISDNGAGGFG